MKRSWLGMGLGLVLGSGCAEPPREDDPEDTLPPSGTAPPTSSTDPTTDPSEGDETGTKLDVGEDDTGPEPPTEVDFSFIWIANSEQGTVSKIDTQSGDEVARYATGPAEQAEPSRTSVNLLGDVAVSNRGSRDGGFGGVTKIVAQEEDCQDRNGNGTIETSTGPNDVLPWGDDECVLWNLAIPSDMFEHGPRPTAWEGAVDAQGNPEDNPRLWMGWYDFENNIARINRLDGNAGTVLDTVEIPWNGLDFGPYGGAVNAEGDFWVLGWQLGPLIRIDAETLEVERIELPPAAEDDMLSYGMALDQFGNPWLTSRGNALKWDVATGQWQTIVTANQLMRGMMIDSENRAWFAVDDTGASNGCGLGLIDAVTGDVLAEAIELPGCVTPVGISIDVEGFVWVVDQSADAAYKINPDTFGTELVVDGLDAPYTYSDMTGFGLDLVVNPPAG
ncbi:MAG: hypothetical protein AAGA54_22065 [Myxococcota bacterium]